MTGKENWNALAPCGIYCGECSAYLDKSCGGCRSNKGSAKCNSKECKIAVCANSKGHKVCLECPEFPCANTDYFRARKLQDSVWYIDVLMNMKELKKLGLDELCKRKDEWVRKRIACANKKRIKDCSVCEDWPCALMSNPVQTNEPEW